MSRIAGSRSLDQRLAWIKDKADSWEVDLRKEAFKRLKAEAQAGTPSRQPRATNMPESSAPLTSRRRGKKDQPPAIPTRRSSRLIAAAQALVTPLPRPTTL